MKNNFLSQNNFASLLSGFLFSYGLGISGMTKPEKIFGFLNVSGDWDPTLIFVMIGAVGVHAIAYSLIHKRKSPLLTNYWHIPNKKEITPSLLVGAFIFGIGWALAGFCPGPAIVSLASLDQQPIVFVISMSVGMFLFRIFNQKFQLKK